MFNLDEANRKSKETVDTVLRSYAEMTKSFQAIAGEATDYSRKSFQDMGSYMEQLMAARSVEAVYELQTKFAKSAFEGFFAEATKLGEMYTDLAKTGYKPYEAPVARATAVVASSPA
ncbi:phasin family protein [Rhizobium sp. FY34]|uniref:phasin family protein n=1 Tax=Rhizobium sp. FY34 TaxID=2562309 RepID=UPI0010C0586A|nr:phasin family protein [Rhizobium sp. FY34]